MIYIGFWTGWKSDFANQLKAEIPDMRCYVAAEYRQWRANRYIQFSSAYQDNFDEERVNHGIHYEYRGNGTLYLHIEDIKLRYIADYLRKKTREKEGYSWELNRWGIVGHCKKEEFISNEVQLFKALKEMRDFFDPLLIQAKAECLVENNDAPYSRDCVFEELKSDSKENVLSCSMYLNELLTYNLTIPKYQRDYCWEDEQVANLFESLKTILATKTAYHLGTIILHKSTTGELDIIDGQQRLVTLTLLLRELGYDGQLPLLKATFKSENAIKHIANTKYVWRNLLNKIHTNKKDFAKDLSEHLAFSVLVLQKDNLDLAYTFFSNQNSRGVPLTDYDILKAHHLRYIPIEAQAEHLVNRWNRLVAEGAGCGEHNDLSVTLGTHLYRLRQWMRHNDINENSKWRVKKEFSAAPIILSIPPFGECFAFNEKIQGGSHFFAYSDKFVSTYCTFKYTPQCIALNTYVNWGPHKRYADVIETLLFAYYLKFGNQYLSDALYCISSIMADHRYSNARAITHKILKWANQSKIVLMIDQASSPTFFLAEAMCNIKNSRLNLIDNDIRYRFSECLRNMLSSFDDFEEGTIRQKIEEEYEL